MREATSSASRNGQGNGGKKECKKSSVLRAWQQLCAYCNFQQYGSRDTQPPFKSKDQKKNKKETNTQCGFISVKKDMEW